MAQVDFLRALLAGGKGYLQGKEFARQLQTQYQQQEYENQLKAQQAQQQQQLAQSLIGQREETTRLTSSNADLASLGVENYRSPQDIEAALAAAAQVDRERKQMDFAKMIGLKVPTPGYVGDVPPPGETEAYMPIGQTSGVDIASAIGQYGAEGMKPGTTAEYGGVQFKAPAAQTPADKRKAQLDVDIKELEKSDKDLRFSFLSDELKTAHSAATTALSEAKADLEIAEAKAEAAPELYEQEAELAHQKVFKAIQEILKLKQDILFDKQLQPYELDKILAEIEWLQRTPGFKEYDLETGRIRARASTTSAAASMINANKPSGRAVKTPINAARDAMEKEIAALGMRKRTLEHVEKVINGNSDLTRQQRKFLLDKARDTAKATAPNTKTPTGILVGKGMYK